MSSRRTVILIGAIVIGAIAAAATLRYVSGIEDRAEQDAQQIEVFVATDTIPEGTSVAAATSAGLIERTTVAQRNVPVDAITAIDQLGDKVAVVNIAARTTMTNSLWVDSSAVQVTNAERIPPGMVAISFSVDQVRGVAGLIVPGDKINLMVTRETEDLTEESAEAAAAGEDVGVLARKAYTLYQSVGVLFVGQRAGVTAAEQAAEETDQDNLIAGGSNLLTVAVPPEAAEIIASVGQSDLYLALLPPDYENVPLVPGPEDFIIEGQTPKLLPSSDPAQLTPYGPDGFPEED